MSRRKKPSAKKYLEEYLKMEGRGKPGGRTRLDSLRDLDRHAAERGMDKTTPEDEARFLKGE